jgi:hypothetical protein
MYTGRKKFSIKFELLKEKIHKTKRIRVECCRTPSFIGEADCWAFVGMNYSSISLRSCLHNMWGGSMQLFEVKTVKVVEIVKTVKTVQSFLTRKTPT